MICSPEMLAANRKNALRSSGPRSAGGKANSARNALKHGMTGAGVAPLAGEAERIEDVARGLRAQYRPTTPLGHAMIDRTAVLVVRSERMALHERAMVAQSVQQAGEAFDQARLDLVEEIFAELESDPVGTVDLLTDVPEGIDRINLAWSEIREVEEWTPDVQLRADRLSGGRFGREVPAGEGFEGLRAAWIEAEVDRLGAVRESLDHEVVAEARAIATAIALFPTTPEAILARRYDAATSRELDRSFKAIKQAEAKPQDDATPAEPEPSEPVASFGKNPDPHRSPVEPPLPPAAPTAPEAPADRSKRPDPRKMREARRHNRR